MKTKVNFGMTFKSTGDKTKREIEGYASTPDLDRDGDIIPSEVLKSAVDEYLKMGTLLYDHGHDPTYARKPIGKLHTGEIDGEGRLYVKGTISDDWIWEKIELEELKAFSIAGRVEWEIQEAGDRVIGVAKSLDLYEISVVAIPANPNAIFQIAKTFQASFEKGMIKNKAKLYNKDIELTDTHMHELFKKFFGQVDELRNKLQKGLEGEEEVKEEEVTTPPEPTTPEENEEEVKEEEEVDEKDKQIEDLQKQLAEKDKELTETKENIANLEKTQKELDEKLEKFIKTKKKAVSVDTEKAQKELKTITNTVEENARKAGLIK